MWYFACTIPLIATKMSLFQSKCRSLVPIAPGQVTLLTCHLDQSLSAWRDENRGGATLSAGGPWCLYGPMLVKSSLAVFVLLHYTGWWSKCFSSLNAAGRDIRCPGGAVWWAGQAGRFCREVKWFFLSFLHSTAIPMQLIFTVCGCVLRIFLYLIRCFGWLLRRC